MKHTFFLLTMLFASSLFANNDCITYEGKVGVLFLQPNGSNLYYGAEALPLPIPTPNWKSLEIRPDFEFGFDIGGKALFTNTCIGVELNWERLHSCDSASRSVPETDMLGPYFNIGPEAAAYTNAHGHAKQEFDRVNLHFVREMDCFSCLKANYFAGVAFARIKQTVSSRFFNDTETLTKSVKSPSLYYGAGPEFGVDFDYNFCGNFSFTGESSFALFTGCLENKTNYVTTVFESEVPQPNKQKTDVPNRTQVVPSFGGKLGFSYETCCNCFDIKLDFGYMAEVYFNAIQTVEMSTEVFDPPADSIQGVYVLGFRRTVSNFMLTGPYVSLTIDF